MKHDRQNAREQGRIVLAHGEVTGHAHEVVTEAGLPPGLDRAQYFTEPDGTRMLVVLGDEPVYLRHDEHCRITLDPTAPVQVRQGDVLLDPAGPGAWRVIRQQELLGEAWQQVAD